MMTNMQTIDKVKQKDYPAWYATINIARHVILHKASQKKEESFNGLCGW